MYGGKRGIERSGSANRGEKEVEIRKYPLLVFPASSSFRSAVGADKPSTALLHHAAISACTEGSIRPAEMKSSAGQNRIVVKLWLWGVALCLAFRSEFRRDP